MKTMSLTAKQETLAQNLASGMTQADAYRSAYPASKTWKKRALYAEASKQAKNPDILRRVYELRAPVIERVRYELEDAMREAEAARRLAMADPKGAGAAVSAVALKAKLNGLMVEDRQNERTPFSELSDDELDRAIAETGRAIARAKGQAPASGISAQKQ